MKRIISTFIYAMILSTITLPLTASCSREDDNQPIINGTQENNKNQDPEGIETMTFHIGKVQFRMIAVEGGTFIMGANDSNVPSDQKPAHKVTLSDYFIGQTEVTQELWTAIMGSNPSVFKGKNLPVENVTWNACHDFINRLNKLLHDSDQLARDRNFSLPSEAQWEYAARGGNKSQGYKYAGSNNIDAVAWTRGNTDRTHPVTSKMPNELGLYDMSGNVWEWVEDYYAPYNPADQRDPVNNKDKSSGLVIKRGGSWYYSQEERFTPTFRYGYYTSITDSSIGVRLCLR